jgi:hypothetical protein
MSDATAQDVERAAAMIEARDAMLPVIEKFLLATGVDDPLPRVRLFVNCAVEAQARAQGMESVPAMLRAAADAVEAAASVRCARGSGRPNRRCGSAGDGGLWNAGGGGVAAPRLRHGRLLHGLWPHAACGLASPRRRHCGSLRRKAELMGAEIAIADTVSPPARAEGGRPSLYDPAYCGQVVEFCADGACLTEFAASINVSRRTLTHWTAAHDEFAEAVAVAKAKAAAWYGRQAREIALGKGGPGAAAIVTRALNNFAPEDWTETQRHEHQHAHLHVEMTREQLLDEARRLGLPTRIFPE